MQRSRRGNAARRGKTTVTTETDRLRHLAAERVHRVVDQLAATAPVDALESVLEAPTDFGSGARLFAALTPLSPAVSELDPFANAFLRGADLKERLIEQAEGALPAGAVAAALGITRQALEKRRARKRLLGVRDGSGEWLYPAFQFTAEGSTLPGLAEVFTAFPDSYDPWMRLSAIVSESEVFGRSIVEVLRDGDSEEVRRAVHLIADLGN